jgi:hypothetical protein
MLSHFVTDRSSAIVADTRAYTAVAPGGIESGDAAKVATGVKEYFQDIGALVEPRPP